MFAFGLNATIADERLEFVNNESIPPEDTTNIKRTIIHVTFYYISFITKD